MVALQAQPEDGPWAGLIHTQICHFLREGLASPQLSPGPACAQAALAKPELLIVLAQFPPWPCPPSNMIFNRLGGG